MGKMKICASCKKIVNADGEDTGKKSWAFLVLLCSRIEEVMAGNPSLTGSLDLPTVNGMKPSLNDLVVCKRCENTIRTKLPVFRCRGCCDVSVVICTDDCSTEQIIISEDVKRRWRCRSCHKQIKGMEIKWKCLKCFAKGENFKKCKKPVSEESKKLQCHRCNSVYHQECGTYATDGLQKVLKDIRWLCKECLACDQKEDESNWKRFGKKAAIGAGLTAVCLGGIPLAVGALGFGAAGVAAGSLAAAYQSAFLGGTIVSGSVFATLQSIGAAGLAVSTQAGIAAACTSLPFLGDLMKKKP